jgi:Pex2 / Pex12 amino terminal region
MGEMYQYPFAASPDIIRSYQKDAYFQGILLEQLSNILRKLYGARFAHTYTSEAGTFSELLYLGLTTFVGNRTLGEEYCDIVQVEDDTLRLPSLQRRAGYILSNPASLLADSRATGLPTARAYEARIKSTKEERQQIFPCPQHSIVPPLEPRHNYLALPHLRRQSGSLLLLRCLLPPGQAPMGPTLYIHAESGGKRAARRLRGARRPPCPPDGSAGLLAPPKHRQRRECRLGGRQQCRAGSWRRGIIELGGLQ